MEIVFLFICAHVKNKKKKKKKKKVNKSPGLGMMRLRTLRQETPKVRQSVIKIY
jgi:hypothetical protein